MAENPMWKRVLGGLCGIGIMVAVFLMLRQRDVSGDDVQQWETAIVVGAGAAGAVYWIVKRRQQR